MHLGDILGPVGSERVLILVRVVEVLERTVLADAECKFFNITHELIGGGLEHVLLALVLPV